MEKELVSVIIPLYNCEKYIKDAIYSCIEQTYQNLEIIIIDDASTDSSIDKVLEINDSRIHIFRNKENLGPGETRNIGINNASGRYIAFLDADDYWSKDKIEQGIGKITDDTLFVYSKRVEVFENGSLIEPRLHYSSGKIFTKLLKNNFITASSIIFDKKLIKLIGTNLIMQEDRYFFGYEDYILNLKASVLTKICFDKKSVVYYRIHENQITKKDVSANKHNRDISIRINIFLDLCDYFKSKKIVSLIFVSIFLKIFKYYFKILLNKK